MAGSVAPALPVAGSTSRSSLLRSNVPASSETTASPFWSRPEAVTAERRWLHPLLAFGLTSLTFGLYGLYWLFDTWRQIKRHDGDAGKHPVGHMLAVFVPFYNLTRIHAHMRTIIELVHASGGQTSLAAGTVVWVWILAGILMRVSDEPGYGLLLFLAAALYGAIVAWGQAALNHAWYLNAPQARARPTHPVNWVVLGTGVILSTLAVIGLVAPS